MDIRTLIEQTLGFTFPCPIREITAEGLYAHYENGQAEVGGSTVPALARAYMLLAKELSADRTNDPGGRYRDLVRHLPFRPVDQLDISLESPELHRRTVAHFTELIQQVSDLGVDKFVLHPGTPLPVGCDRNQRKNALWIPWTSWQKSPTSAVRSLPWRI